jgi:hypothetical protein
MKKAPITLSWIIAISIVFTQSTKAQQSLSQVLNNIKSKVTEVQVDKTTYKQSLDVLDEQKGKVKLTIVEVDDKGKAASTAYEFYISDLDKNTLIRKTEGKKLFVSLSIYNKQKFVKLLKEDKLDSYVDNVQILVNESDAAQSIIDNVKSAIPLVKSGEKSWSSASEALAWLKNNIKDVTGKDGNISQAFSYDDKKNYLVKFSVKSQDSKGVTTEEYYNFNLTDINKTKLQVKVIGTSLSVNLETKGLDKNIQYTKNGVLQSFASDVDIYADDIDQARNLISAFTAVIEKSKPSFASYSTLQQATDYINTNIGEVKLDTKPVKQKIAFVPGEGTKVTFTTEETDSKGKVIVHSYDFYLADIEPASVNFKVSGKKAMLLFTTVSKSKLIKYSKDNAVQSFVYDLEILHSDIEILRELIAALNAAVKESAVSPLKWTNVDAAVDFLDANIKGETVGTDQYKLAFESDGADPFPCEYSESRTDSKGVTTDEKFLFYPYTIDVNTIKIESAGKYLKVSAYTKDKKSLIKKIKTTANSFGSELEIMAFDAKQAKNIAEALKYLATTAIPKEKDWSNKEIAMKYVVETIGNFSNAGKEVKQKVELVSNDPCKINFTVSTIDNKGVTTEEIFEFSLTDMNKLMVEYKTTGGNVFIKLTCKNQQKLIKVYKNGVQQSYASSVEIMEDDVDTAKNMADALRNAIIKCE